MKNIYLLILSFVLLASSYAQETNGRSFSIFASSGLMNYQGDLMPNSFTLDNSNPYVTFGIHQPLFKRVALKAGAGYGSLQAADRDNRGYLVPRNLSFYTGIKEVFAGFELSAFDIEKTRFTPVGFIGGALFHFNPWTNDINGEKVYLQPLGTEGQGLAKYPGRQPYSLTQFAICYGAGLKYALDNNFTLGLELNHRKTFTDYIDDVSSTYADRASLLEGRGQKAVDLAYRGDELPGGAGYPHEGDIRGTPTESDWYYFVGFSLQVKLSVVRNKINKIVTSSPDYYVKRCPTVF